MARDLLKVEFDEAAMLKKLNKFAKEYGETQEQAVKRWGVQTCRELAKYTQIFGSQPTRHKLMLFKDANKVIYTFKGRAKAAKKGNGWIAKNDEGRRIFIPNDRIIQSEEEIINWIGQNRVGKSKRTRKLPIHMRKACNDTLLRRAINQKFKQTAGMAKDGWLDAGEDISKGQKGPSPAKIGKSLMKFSRKPLKLGRSREGKRFMKAFGELQNKVSYSSNKNVLRDNQKRDAIRDGAIKTMKWYKRVIRANQRKKR